MSTGFQGDAFQSDAFQIEGGGGGSPPVITRINGVSKQYSQTSGISETKVIYVGVSYDELVP